MEIEEKSSHVSLCEYSSLLQITVCQVPGGIFGGDDVTLYVFRKGGSLHGRWLAWFEEHTPHALLGSIYRANHQWVVGHNLHKVSWALGNAAHEGFEINQMVPEV